MVLSKINYYRSPHFGGYTTKNGGRLEEWRRQYVGIWLISLSSSHLHTASKDNLKVNITHYMQDSQRSG